MKIEVKAYAKINLLLDIVSTRKDGYHDLFMILSALKKEKVKKLLFPVILTEYLLMKKILLINPLWSFLNRNI